MKEVAKYIYDHPDRPESELIIHGLHDEKGVFLQYVKDQDVRVIVLALKIMGIQYLYLQTAPIILWKKISENQKEILDQFNKLFFK